MAELFNRLSVPNTLHWNAFPQKSYSIQEGLNTVFQHYDRDPHFSYFKKVVCISAGLGVGKTTALPIAIHQILNKRVAIAVPKVSIALGVQQFLTKILVEHSQNSNIKIQAITGGGKRNAENAQIIIITYGVLKQWLQNKDLTHLIPVIIFDESHNLDQIDTIIILQIIKKQIITEMAVTPRNAQHFWIWQSATPSWEPLLNFFYGNELSPLMLHSHIVQIELQTPKVTLYKNSVPGANLPQDIYKCLEQVSTQGPVLVFAPTYREQKKICEKYEKLMKGRQVQNFSANILNRAAYDVNPDIIQNLENTPFYLVVSTKYGEEGLTYPNLKNVIDPGISILVFQLPELNMTGRLRISSSQTTITQRGGRVGRTQEGNVFQLMTSEEYLSIPRFEPPEIYLSFKDSDFSELIQSSAITAAEQDLIFCPPILMVYSKQQKKERDETIACKFTKLSSS